MDYVVDSNRYRTHEADSARASRVPAAAAAVAAATGLTGLFSVVGADSRWLGALGAAIVRAGHIPKGVPFASAPTAHWPNVPALAELAFHGLLAAGPRGLLVAQIVAVAVAMSLVAVDSRGLGATDGQAAAAVLLATVAALPSFVIIRSQLFSLALFPLLVLLLRADERRPSRRIWLVVPLVALWSNLHGALLVGLVVLAVYLAVSRLRRSPLETIAVGAAAALACCLTPALWRTPTYYAGVLDNEAARRGEGFWGPLSLHSGWDIVLIAGGVALIVAALRARPAAWELVALVALAAGSVHAARVGVWLVLFVAPLAALGLPTRSARPRVTAAVLAVGAAAACIALAHGPGSTGVGDALLTRTLADAHGRTILAQDTLGEQVALAGGRIWVGNPIDAFRHRDQATYVAWVEGRPEGDAALTHADVVLVARHGPAERRLARDRAFRPAGADRKAMLFVRRSGGAR
jgi:hypothetical protein